MQHIDMSILKLSKLLKIFEEYTSKFGSHLKMADRISVLQEVERTFDNHEIYPPFMKETELNVYEGDIDDGWVLKVQDDPRKYWLNGKEFDNLREIIEEYKNKDNKDDEGDEGDEGGKFRVVSYSHGYRTIYHSDLNIKEALKKLEELKPQEIYDDEIGFGIEKYNESTEEYEYFNIDNLRMCTCGSGMLSPMIDGGCDLGTEYCG